MTAIRGIALICLAFFVLGLIYSVATPIFEASDERWHYPVVKHLADGRGLPLQDPAVETPWHQEGSQPPLYYALAAGLTFWIDTGDFAQAQRPNPHAIVGQPLVVGNKNMMLHDQRDGRPWRGAWLAVHLIRFFSLALATVTVWLTWRIAREAWPGDDGTPLFAAALTAFNPMFLFISASVNNDNLVAPLAAGVVLVLLRVLRRGQSPADGPLLGLLLGLGALSKLSMLGLIPLVAFTLTWDAYRHRAWRMWWQNGLLSAGLLLALAGWWYWRNWNLYGDPTGLNRMLDIAGRRAEPANLLAEFEGFRISYWGLFGAVNIIAPTWIYRALDALTALGGLGLGVWLVRKRLSPAANGGSIGAGLLLLAWVLIVLLGLIRWTSLTYASQGRLMFVAIAGVSTSLAIGLSSLIPGRWQRPVLASIGGGLLLFAVASPFLYIAPAYARPPLLREADLPTDLDRLDWVFDGKMKLLGYRLDQTAVRAAETLPVEVYWQALEPMSLNYSVFVQLQGRGREVVGALNTYPGLGLRPTSSLSPGDIVADTYLVPVSPQAEEQAPARARLAIGLYDYGQPGRPARPAVDARGRPLADPAVAEIKLLPWQWPDPQPQLPLNVQFDDGIGLLGVDSSCDLRPGPCALTLYWQATATPTADYQVFIQLWDDERHVAGFDGPPVDGNYPTRWWAAGEVIIDRHGISMPDELPSGDYRWLVGLYRLDAKRGARLPAYAPDGAPLPDFAVTLDAEQLRP
ncbi:MAG: glycosyltransferase family 39 protein [Anaerolineae bacterium]